GGEAKTRATTSAAQGRRREPSRVGERRRRQEMGPTRRSTIAHLPSHCFLPS
ncbi:hypothetical protein CCACVL1_15126, partial [Corchorus capsularis]